MAYCTIQDIRDEGVSTTDAPDSRLAMLIQFATEYVDRMTQWWFEPRYLTFHIDGTDARNLHVSVPIIQLDELATLDSLNFATVVDPKTYRVYNRHLDGLTIPDDRRDPRITLITILDLRARLGHDGLVWPRGEKNIRLKGYFGYTDYDPTGGAGTAAALESGSAQPFALADGQTLLIAIDNDAGQLVTFSAADFANIGAATALEVANAINKQLVRGRAVISSAGTKVTIQSDRLSSSSAVQIDGSSTAAALAFSTTLVNGTGNGFGRTPLLINHVTRLLVVREVRKMWDYMNRQAMLSAGRVMTERTRDQEITLQALLARGIFTGDPEIDTVLESLRRPFGIGTI